MSTRFVIYIQESNGLYTLLKTHKEWASIEIQTEVSLLTERCENCDSEDFTVHFYCRHKLCDTYSCRVIELPVGLKPVGDDDDSSLSLVGNCQDHYCCCESDCSQRA